tara:strand:- start:963 stop:1721 length:759 start_codon:yes stop_codon:yes gene_type:complete
VEKVAELYIQFIGEAKNMDNTIWQKVDNEGVIHTAQYKADMAFSNTVLIKISGSLTLVYSPGEALIESAAELVDKDAKLFILLPSVGHISGCISWKAHFKNSVVIAGAPTRDRLMKKTGFGEVKELSFLESKLATNISLFELPGCRSGEVWVSIETSNKVYWVVCDSFMNVSTFSGGRFARLFWEKIYRIGPGLEITRGFQYGALKDRKAYRQWAVQRFSNRKENVLIPCHGEIDNSPDLGERIVQLLEKKL